ncbi:AAA family ATPase [Pyrofollis japonicus]|nr:AAA family ATPase [Pyrofollis japonicus]
MVIATSRCDNKKNPTIAFSGPPGGGKTTYARRLANELGLSYYSAGSIFRSYAEEKGLSLEELNRLAEKDPSIDYEIDTRTYMLGCKGNVVLEGHLVAWIVSSVADVKIYVTAPLEIRVERIAKREGRDFNDVLRETVAREYMHRHRFLKLYGIDIANLQIFDLVIDTGYLGLEEAYSIIKSFVCEVLRRKGYYLSGCASAKSNA